MGIHSPRGTDFMKGSVHFDKKAKRYFISIYWKSPSEAKAKRYRIFKHPMTGEPFWHEKSAEKQLNRIRTEIDDGTFNPKAWFPDSPMTVRAYAQSWLASIDVTKKTLTSYRGFVRKYIVPFFGETDIRNIRHADLVAFKKHMESQVASKTVYNGVSCLRTMMIWAWRNEDLPKVPPFPKLSFDLPEIEFLTLEQQEMVLNEIPEIHRPIFQIGMEYGLRVGEVRAIKRDCLQGNLLIIRRAFSENTLMEKTKTGNVRYYELTEYARAVLDGMPPSISPFVFTREDGEPYSNKNLNLIWKKACGQVKIFIKLYNGLRHSLGCQLVNMGCDMDLVRQQLGHSKIDMSRRYATRAQHVLTEALEGRRKVIRIKKRRSGDGQ